MHLVAVVAAGNVEVRIFARGVQPTILSGLAMLLHSARISDIPFDRSHQLVAVCLSHFRTWVMCRLLSSPEKYSTVRGEQAFSSMQASAEGANKAGRACLERMHDSARKQTLKALVIQEEVMRISLLMFGLDHRGARGAIEAMKIAA